ncbi:flavohemoglobin expression-modulating QEGLA motif protein (plasmid) [Ensifer adhaerens]|uniref:flavohemoglobin expression-modulating QEGLA motif protein n=1 Tax=Ensifer adhaerens TaxID=106592 RepID=UPI0023A95F28|nr:flavohemoglobin expression-modulating QEGLA motif protein [Ensifer adhaerens]WDZ80120.1 flavohemoglobin expression-modulating QEGLA motif protein [Ensifer adhaerens]
MTDGRPILAHSDRESLDEAITRLKDGRAVRRDFREGGRLHIDRLLPFLCVHVAAGREQPVARDIAQANAAYLLAPSADIADIVIERVGRVIEERLGMFIVLEFAELESDDPPAKDAPFLLPFLIEVVAGESGAEQVAAKALIETAATIEGKFRTPHVTLVGRRPDVPVSRKALALDYPHLTVRFAPIYCEPGTRRIYPQLRERLVASVFDAGLRAIAAFVRARSDDFRLPTHRAFGRKAFVDAVVRADRGIDEIASGFDFLLAVTPINAEAAWAEFASSGFSKSPRLYYRPLTLQIEAAKRKLFTLNFEHLEDPLLYALYREKQQEIDLQLSMISARETRTFVEFGRALYGPVEGELLNAAIDILARTGADDGVSPTSEAKRNCDHIRERAQAMISTYRRQSADFTASVEIRDDLPAGLLVSRGQLLIARSSALDPDRVEALLNHEVGVHLLTYFNGSAQGLRILRSGLAGYEGMQEGLAVFAEYLSAGMTTDRLRVLAARVVACAALLDGALFPDTYRLLVDDHGFGTAEAFNMTLRIYRGGGLVKDAIYLRGLLELLDHLADGGSLEPFWMGKIAASHFGAIQELNLRGLLGAAAVRPIFLDDVKARDRLQRAQRGMTPLDMVAD